MSAPGFATDEAGLRGREEAVAAVARTLREAAAAATVAGSPDAYGLLCSFFPALLDPVALQARGALDRAAAVCLDTVGDLRGAHAAFTDTDDAGATGPGR